MGRQAHKANRRAILIAGPTASGKSGLAISLAEREGGVIVNADSMQVYRDLRVVTSRPSKADEARVSHRLYGYVGGDEAYSVGRWLAEAGAVLDEVWAAGGTPILVGGTGLYFTSLEEGLSAIPDIPDDVRARWRGALEERGAKRLYEELAARDGRTAAMLRPSDAQRIVRALEVLEATGRVLADWHDMPAEDGPLAGADVRKLVLAPRRSWLHHRIDARFGLMIETGALTEVEALMTLGLSSDRPVMKAIGVPELMRHLAGAFSLAEAIREAQTRTRRYAKRQETWFRHRMANWPRLDPEAFGDDPDRLAEAALALWDD